MTNNEFGRKLTKIGYRPGERVRHCIIWNCPCPPEKGAHPVGVGLHPSDECYFQGFKKQLGSHYEEFMGRKKSR